MRIEINLPDHIANAISELAAAQNRSRKNYIETLCVIAAGRPAILDPDGVDIVPLAKTSQKAVKQAYVPKQFPPIVSFKPKKPNKNG